MDYKSSDLEWEQDENEEQRLPQENEEIKNKYNELESRYERLIERKPLNMERLNQARENAQKRKNKLPPAGTDEAVSLGGWIDYHEGKNQADFKTDSETKKGNETADKAASEEISKQLFSDENMEKESAKDEQGEANDNDLENAPDEIDAVTDNGGEKKSLKTSNTANLLRIAIVAAIIIAIIIIAVKCSSSPDNGDNDTKGEAALRSIAAADKTELVSGLEGDYPNLKGISYNPELTYQEEIDYGISGIEESKPLEDNIWYEMGGSAVYYDETAVRAVAWFDSLLKEYVNKKDGRIFDIVGAKSKAAQLLNDYNTDDRIDKLDLEIGEIRINGEMLYVWTQENMQVIVDGKDVNQEKSWIFTIKLGEKNPEIEGYLIDGYYDYKK